MISNASLIVIGAGGLGQEFVWAADNMNRQNHRFKILGFADDDKTREDASFAGLPILGSIETVSKKLLNGIHAPMLFACAVGDNSTRKLLVARAEQVGWQPVSLIDPNVIIAHGVTFGQGSYIAANVVLSPNATIGNHVIINHGCSIGHDSVLEDFVQVAPGGRVSGFSKLKKGSYIGSNGVIAPGKTLGIGSTLGACSFALTNIPDNATAVGNPAKIVQIKDHVDK